MHQSRWVSYIYRYRDNVRCENAGFIKVQKISNGVSDYARIQIGLKIYKKYSCVCRLYLICGEETEGSRTAEYMTDMKFAAGERDTIVKRIEVPWENPLGKNKPVAKYDGILFVCDDGELLTGMWKEAELKPEQIRYGENENLEVETESEAENESEPEIDVKPVVESDNEQYEDITSEAYAAEAATEQECESDPCIEIFKTYPQLPLFADSQFTECVKIVPQDIGKLAMSNWKLGVNSFLSHGYYHYRYLMLGKVMLNEKEKVVIGVPGVFTNKERYLANMFGFTIFVPAKKTELLTGKFGYWVLEVSNV